MCLKIDMIMCLLAAWWRIAIAHEGLQIAIVLQWSRIQGLIDWNIDRRSRRRRRGKRWTSIFMMLMIFSTTSAYSTLGGSSPRFWRNERSELVRQWKWNDHSTWGYLNIAQKCLKSELKQYLSLKSYWTDRNLLELLDEHEDEVMIVIEQSWHDTSLILSVSM